MSVSTDYLNIAKSKFDLKNQNQLAIFFDVTRQSMNHYYSGKRNFDIAMLLKVSEALEVPVEEIGIKLCIEHARTEKNKNYWRNKLDDYLSK